jgi:hypothetical protein
MKCGVTSPFCSTVESSDDLKQRFIAVSQKSLASSGPRGGGTVTQRRRQHGFFTTFAKLACQKRGQRSHLLTRRQIDCLRASALLRGIPRTA